MKINNNTLNIYLDKFYRFPFCLYGLLISSLGLLLYIFGVLLGFFRIFFDPSGHLLWVIDRTIWYSGSPVVLGLILIIVDLFLFLPKKRNKNGIKWAPLKNNSLTVVLTAYNDESSIALAVKDFYNHPNVNRVIVIDNNSTDNTSKVALEAGALVFKEYEQGYGHCVWRALKEGCKFDDTDLILLCEGDMTFRSYDIDKFLAYLPHAEIVNGTRICEQLRAKNTQLTTFMYYGNFFVGKLLEIKHLSKGTFTDVGTTYKLCRKSTLTHLLPLLNKNINLEFNAHFLDTALTNGIKIVECPITFHNRIGASKGGNINNYRAMKVGSNMILGILFGWREK
ncbi:glycosyltransferase [Methylomarinum sp. Ch1-1]|uniref:Glycosyltransferase n=1 Tax=Methylomarinum roseum TaxID=3067653 RepID=A0AAU7NT04_9GAMM|nr:glycosyltransferase [Methylomarinum sp. Ch1-1]MDP4519856.1 glycosyltransferase [Methylomarinum sp. Ch1-1]